MEYGITFAAVVFLILAAFGKMIYRCLVNPITVFCGIWAIILFGYSIHAYDLYYASSESLQLIIIGVAMFFVGAVIATVFYSNYSKVKNIDASITINNDELRYNILFILNILSFLFLIGFGLTVIRQLISGSSFYYVHRMYNDEEGLIASSTTSKNIVTWFVWPLMHVSLATLPIAIQCDKNKVSKIRKYCIIIILANLALFTTVSGKRGFLANLIMYFLAVFYMQGKKVRLKRKTKFGIFLIIVGLLSALNYISIGRGNTSITKTLYVYLVGCIPHLSAKLQNSPVNPVGLTSVYGFFQGPLIIINTLFRSSLLSNIRNSMSAVHTYTQERVFIGPGMTFNAFLSPFYFFNLDGGMVGNIIFSFLFGFIAVGVYQNHLKKRTSKSMLIYLLVFFSLYMSMVRIQYFQMRFALSFLYVMIIFSNYTVKFTFGKKKDQKNDI